MTATPAHRVCRRQTPPITDRLAAAQPSDADAPERDDFSSKRHPAPSFLFEHDLRANAFAFVARENRYTLFRIML
jgi:hypothetical protein